MRNYDNRNYMTVHSLRLAQIQFRQMSMYTDPCTILTDITRTINTVKEWGAAMEEISQRLTESDLAQLKRVQQAACDLYNQILQLKCNNSTTKQKPDTDSEEEEEW